MSCWRTYSYIIYGGDYGNDANVGLYSRHEDLKQTYGGGDGDNGGGKL